MRRLLAILTAIAVTACTAYHTVKVEPGDTDARVIAKAAQVVPTPGQLHSLDNGFEAFVHFGPNTFTGVEWGSGIEDPAVFNLQSLDTDQWCRCFKAAGMKRVILTAKHHDGFVLWPSRYTGHGVASSPYQGDVVKELSASCAKYGLEFGFYLSPADLYQMESPDGLYGNGSEATLRTIPRPVHDRPFTNKTTFQFEVDDYNEYFLNQLFELLTEYGPVSEVWFDGAHPKRKGGQQYNYLAWKELIHTLAPQAVVFGKEDLRWCGNEAGETRGTEWNVIPYAQDPSAMNMFDDLTDADLGSRDVLLRHDKPFWLHYQPAETDVSIRNGWFWRNDDEQAVRSAADVFDIWERSTGGNSILLLNVPPNTGGRISRRDSCVLAEVGELIKDTYSNDLLQGARRRSTRDGIEFQLPLAVRFNRLLIEENPGKGERVEEFALDVWADGWQEVARGTNIGHRRILRFPEQNAAAIRVRILKSRARPHLGHISAYNHETL
jgi:alpha-L-fucosidase